ncbi:mitotic spindle checkpoint protein Bub3 [Tilletia horrida]|nr:mitotic spindle checkpoint protein Bub3 [Tilletia horrida]KAK0541552.1 mitotic spindle checkpoint protein Bub3 [Tilletia horrida]
MELELPSPPSQPISALAFSTDPPGSEGSERLLVASWDKSVTLYDLAHAKTGEDVKLLQSWAHEAPVLDVCWVGREVAASGGVDRRVRLLDTKTGTSEIIGKHDMPVSRIRYSAETKLLITGSWDRTLKVWDPASRKLLRTISLGEKVLAMDITRPSVPTTLPQVDSTPRLVVGLTSRKVNIYNLNRWAEAADRELAGISTTEEDWVSEESRESSLKFMFKDARCMPDGSGFAMSSVEGRVSVDFFNPSDEVQAKKYAFKCHRQPGEDGIDTVFPINALAFHPRHGSFATLGGDAIVLVWDPFGKRRIRVYPKYPAALSAGDFSADGKWLAMATGAEGVSDDGDGDVMSASVVKGPVTIVVRRVGDETKPKTSKSRKA